LSLLKNKNFQILALIELVLIITGFIYILFFPDFDTDAYAHHCIARQIYLGTSNLNIHWVWLPLFHYIQVGFIALGLSMQVLRFINLIIIASIPLILFNFLNQNEDKEQPYSEALIAGIICALFPVLLLMGTTAQPEPVFCLLILLFIISFIKNKFWLASFYLTILVLLRYEAWILPPLIIFLVLLQLFFKSLKIFKNDVPLWKPLITVIIPIIAMVLWTLARAESEGVWFGFIFGTQGFANEVLQSTSSFDSGILKFIYDLFYYPVIVPYFLSGPLIILAYFGIKKTFKKLYPVSSIFYLAILLFLTITWIKKSSLGLHRHFAVMVPYYSVLLVCGIPFASKLILRMSSKIKGLKIINEVRDNKLKKIKKFLAIILIISQITVTVIWSAGWLGYTSKLFVERYQTAEFLKTLPQDKIIFCDEASVEVLSNLDMKRFNRKWLENNDAYDLITNMVKDKGEVYIATWEKKINLYKGLGEIIFTSSADYNTKERLQVLRITK